MKKSTFAIIVSLIICTLCIGCTEKTTPPDIDAVRNAAKRSAKYLAKSVKENGMFEYRINLNPAIKVRGKYNILRHAGTIFAMSTYYQMHPDKNLQSAIKQAGQYLRDQALNPISEKDNLLAVWSKPEVNKTGNPLQAKLGGTGLGLVALLSIEKIQPGFTPLSDLQSLGRFIVYMQKEDGSFYSKYIPSLGGRRDQWTSLYYPGEAALGLLMLYEKDASNVWLESAARVLEYLALSRKDKTDIPADHWALLATEKLLSPKNNGALPVSRELLINHAVQICNTILQNQIIDPESPEYDGSFSKDGRTTPTATRLEGLQAALNFLPPNHKPQKRIMSAVTRGIAFLLRAQITEGEFIGAFPRATAEMEENTPNAKIFNRRATEVRIDYVQHALSAMIQYLKLKDNGDYK